MNKRIYLGVYIASLAVGVLGLGLVIVYQVTQEFLYRGIRREFPNLETIVVALAVIAGLQVVIVYTIYYFVLLAKMWGSIQDGYARTTPGKAIGFLFIPFFNIYWLFNVWGGFPADYNSFVTRYQLPVQPLSSTLFVVFPIFVLLSGITYGVTLFINLFLILAVISKVCNAVNAVAAHKGVSPIPR
ncbi:MAG TPA: hypothetical protein VNA17_12165 [Pyrinomonadaceae bacterium]|nr:hypothetical protein [Pyrinomonadaceae bacterium]